MAMLSNGCVCCQVGSDLAFTIDRLISEPAAGRRRAAAPDHPGDERAFHARPVLRHARDARRASDASGGDRRPSISPAAPRWPASMKRWRNGRPRIASWRRRPILFRRMFLPHAPSAIAAVNPLAEVIAGVANRGERGAGGLRAARHRRRPCARSAPIARRAHPRVALCLAKPAGEVAFADLAAWLDNLAGALGERLLRIKGLVRVNGKRATAADRKRRHDVLAAAPAEGDTARRPRPSSSSSPAT